MPDDASKTFGSGPVEEFVDEAITDPAELQAMQKVLRRPASKNAAANHSPNPEPGGSSSRAPRQSPSQDQEKKP